MAEVVLGGDVNTLSRAIANGEFIRAALAEFCALAEHEFQCDAEFGSKTGLSAGH
jgi:hypothetical protein